VVVEEATPTGGGLYSAVCQWHASCAKAAASEAAWSPDELALGNFKRETLRRRWNYDSDAVAHNSSRALEHQAIIVSRRRITNFCMKTALEILPAYR